MAMRDIVTGGACNVNDQTAQRNQNPMMRFMDQAVLGNAQLQNKMGGFQPNQGPQNFVEQQIKEQQMQNMLEAQFQQQMNNDNQMMNQVWQNEQQKNIEQQQMMQKEFQMQQHFQAMQLQQNEQIWQQEQHKIQMEQQMMHQQFDAEQQQYQNQISGMEKVFTETQQEIDAEKFAKDFEKENVQQAANEMFDQMSQDPDPRFKNSKFLGFLDKLKTGELEIQGKELIVNENIKQQNLEKNMEEAWDSSKQEQMLKNQEQTKFMNQVFNEEEQKYDGQKMNMDQVFQNEDEKFKNEQDLEEFWAQRIKEYEAEKQDDEKFQSMLEQQYKEVLKQMGEAENMEGLLSEAWQGAADLEEQTMYKDSSDKYHFAVNNPYMNHENPFQLGLEFMAKGRPTDAILAFEAALQKNLDNPANGNTWRIMGRLQQENDSDQKAVSCLLNALKFDDKNLDTLLALGISCTNILDEVKAMNFLKQWIVNNKSYEMIQIDPMIIPSDKAEDFTHEEIKHMNAKMLDLFEHARSINPNDPELLNSLAVLYFISRDYEKSVICFKNALQFDQDNYSLWNKLGATLAHLGRTEEAMEAYYRALDIKPNYVRVWVNLGIAHAYKSDYQEAARFYLNALSFNPDAKHIWSYLQTTFMCMQRYDLVQKIADHDVNKFSGEFEILNIDQLPDPEIDYKQTCDKVVVQEKLNSWVGEMKNQGTNQNNQANNWANQFNSNQ